MRAKWLERNVDRLPKVTPDTRNHENSYLAVHALHWLNHKRNSVDVLSTVVQGDEIQPFVILSFVSKIISKKYMRRSFYQDA